MSENKGNGIIYRSGDTFTNFENNNPTSITFVPVIENAEIISIPKVVNGKRSDKSENNIQYEGTTSSEEVKLINVNVFNDHTETNDYGKKICGTNSKTKNKECFHINSDDMLFYKEGINDIYLANPVQNKINLASNVFKNVGNFLNLNKGGRRSKRSRKSKRMRRGRSLRTFTHRRAGSRAR